MRERETDRETERETDRETERETERVTERDRDRAKEKEIERESPFTSFFYFIFSVPIISLTHSSVFLHLLTPVSFSLWSHHQVITVLRF